MSFSLAQQNTGSAGNVGSYAIALGSSTPVGNQVIAVVASASLGGTVTATDSAGNTYSTPATGTDAGGNVVTILRSAVTHAGTLTVTLHFSGAGNAYSSAWVGDFSCDGSIGVVAGTGADATSTTASIGAITWTAGANALIIGGAVLDASGGTVSGGTGYTLGASVPYSAGNNYGMAAAYRLNETSGSSAPSIDFTSSVAWGMGGVALVETPTAATLSGPSGAVVGSPVELTIELNAPADASYTFSLPSVSGVTYEAEGGGTITSATVTTGNASVSFLALISAVGTYSLSATPPGGITLSGSPLSVSAILGVAFDSVVSGMPTGFASTATVTPFPWNGSSEGTFAGGTTAVGTVVESAHQVGKYSCRIFVEPAQLPAGTTVRAAWSVGGVGITDDEPQPPSSLLDGGMTPNQVSNQILVYVSNPLSGVPSSGSGTLIFKDPTGTFTRGTMVVPGDGNRTSVTNNPPVA